MNIADGMRLALKALITRRFKVFLNILGIIIGIASVITISVIGNSGHEAVLSEIDKLGANAVCIKPSSGANLSLKQEDSNYLRAIFNTTASATAVYTNMATIRFKDTNREAVLWGVESYYKEIFPFTLASGRFLTANDINAQRPVVIIDSALANKLFGTVNAQNKELEIVTKSSTYTVKVVGVIKSAGEKLQNAFSDRMPAFVYAPISFILKVYSYPNIDYISLKTNDSTQLDNAGIKAVRLLERKYGVKNSLYAENYTRQKEQLGAIINIITYIITAVAAISLIVGGLGIMNVMLMNVSERTSEIGIMKAIGAKRRDILIQFLMEAMLITTIGGIGGAVLGIAIGYTVSYFAGLPFALQPQGVVGVILFSTLIGIVFGVYPANKAAALVPIEALNRR